MSSEVSPINTSRKKGLSPAQLAAIGAFINDITPQIEEIKAIAKSPHSFSWAKAYEAMSDSFTLSTLIGKAELAEKFAKAIADAKRDAKAEAEAEAKANAALLASTANGKDVSNPLAT
jgi:hypothetical protein